MKTLIKAIVIVGTMCGLCLDAEAQNAAGKKLRPEFTVRGNVQIYDAGTVATAGLRLNDKWTVGILAGKDEMYIDAAPGHIYSIETCAYQRFCIHLGKRDIISLYSDIAVGVDWIYNVTGKYHYDQTGEPVSGELIDENPGDVKFVAIWQPGIKIRFYKNIHIFAGPMISTRSMGLHLGIGF